jgi:uncharacterized protein (DUF4415 family)
MRTRRKAIASHLGQQISERAPRASAAGGKAGKKKSRAGVPRGAGFGVFKAPDWQKMVIGDMFRPLKKPVTVRLDADVLAWFKRGGPRYQTRINAALRKVMEQELKKSQ